jgi:hypothetical protein
MAGGRPSSLSLPRVALIKLPLTNARISSWAFLKCIVLSQNSLRPLSGSLPAECLADGRTLGVNRNINEGRVTEESCGPASFKDELGFKLLETTIDSGADLFSDGIFESFSVRTSASCIGVTSSH